MTRYDITYAVNVISQFMHALTDVHFATVKRILCYLKKNSSKGLFYIKNEKLSVEAYTAVDWAGSINDKRCTSGYCIYLGGNLMVWRNKRLQ